MELSIKNFKGIEEKNIFLDYKIYLLKGKSGSGKSTICESIKYLLFGGSRNIKPLNSKKKTLVVLKYQGMTISRSKNPEQLKIEEKEKEYYNDEAQFLINSKFNTENIWLLSSYVAQNKRNFFIEASSQEKLEILKELIFKENSDSNLKTFKILINLNKNLTQKINQNDGAIEYIEKELYNLKEENKEYLNVFQEASSIENLQEKIKQLEKDSLIYLKISSYKEKNISLTELENYPENLTFNFIEEWKEYLKYKDEFNSLVVKDYNSEDLNKELFDSQNNSKIVEKYQTENIKELIENIKNNLEYLNYEKKITKIKKLEEYIESLNTRKENLKERWKKVLEIVHYNYSDFNEHQAIKIKENYLEKTRKILNCPSCSQNLFFENNSLKIEKLHISLKDKKFSLETIDSYIKLNNYLMEAENKLSILKKELPEKFNKKVSKTNYGEEDLKVLYTYKENIRNQENIKKDIYNCKLLNKYLKLKKFENFKFKTPINFEDYYERYLMLKEYQKLISKHNIEDDIEEKLKNYKFYQNAIEKCSLIKKKETELKDQEENRKKHVQKLDHVDKLYKIIKETENKFMEMRLGVINQQLNEILDLLFEDINIEIKMFREKTNKPQVNLTIFLGGVEYPNLNYFSGGEKDRISIALTLTFNIILGSPILIFDEVFSSLEEEKREECLNLIRKYARNKILINICHETIEGFYDEIIQF